MPQLQTGDTAALAPLLALSLALADNGVVRANWFGLAATVETADTR